jgi:hypothetical protein
LDVTNVSNTAVASIEVPEAEPREVILEPHAPRPRKGHDDPPAPTDQPASRMALGGPVWRPLLTGDLDIPDPHGLLGQQPSGFQFFLVHLTATFTPTNDEPFKAAEVTVDLDPDRLADPPIAWSLAPDALIDIVKVSREVQLNGSLQIVGLGPLAPGGGSSWTRSASVDRKEAFLLAGNELRSDPYWRLRETYATKVEGMVRLLLVVRSREGAPVHGTIQASAWVERKRYGVWAYEARLPGSAPITFTLA